MSGGDYPPCLRVGCGHTAWAHGNQSGAPRWDEPCHAAVPDDSGPESECSCHGYVREHQVVVWGPAAEGETTISGCTVPAGWVWTCCCGRSEVGLPSELAADQMADAHVPTDEPTAPVSPAADAEEGQ